VYQPADQPASSAAGSTVPVRAVPLGEVAPRGVRPDGVAQAGGPRSAAEALAFVRNGLDWLAAADPASLTGAERAELLRGLAAAESVHLAATTRVLSAFAAAEDYTADGQGGPRTWLAWQTRATRPAAGAVLAWARRLAAYPAVERALAAGSISPSYARRVCDWAAELPADARAAAAQILVQAAVGGADVGELASLVEEIRARTARPDTDPDDEGRRFGGRELFLDTYYRGHGSLRADLTPAAAAAVQAVLDVLGRRAGPEDTRSKTQRDHDALEEACRRLIASGCLPHRDGQPAQITLQMTLSQLLGQAEADPALAASLTTPAPPGADCDAQIVPVVTGTINQVIRTALAGRYLHASDDETCSDGGKDACPACGTAAYLGDASPAGDAAGGLAAASAIAIGPASDVTSSQETLSRARRAASALTIAEAVKLLSGPGGLAARLRAGLTGPAGSISLPLDVGAATDTIPAHVRRAITRRDHGCRFPGCDQPVAACHVHHLRHRADGGETSLANCCLLCTFHHLIAVHRWGWQLILNPDGTTTAVSPDRKRTYHSHAPPTAA
jgi:hypothetical protein